MAKHESLVKQLIGETVGIQDEEEGYVVLHVGDATVDIELTDANFTQAVEQAIIDALPEILNRPKYAHMVRDISVAR